MEYLIKEDIESVLEIVGITTNELADEIGVSRATISNWLNDRTAVRDTHINAFYEYTFKKGIRLNRIKEQFYREDAIVGDEVLLFHGAKTEIIGALSVDHNKRINDFGNGFYCGESLEQSAMFVASHKDSSLYMLKFNPIGLKCAEYRVDRDWMLTIAYYRERLNAFADSNIVSKLVQKRERADYIVAPIADNRMFEIIDSFIDGEITDVQCQHCLSATNLGKQFIFLNQNALNNIVLLEKCYLADAEKDAYLNSRRDSFQVNMDKVKLARKQYRNQGEYIEDILG